MRRRRLALAFVLAAGLALVWAQGSGCRRKEPPRKYQGWKNLPTTAPYTPPPSRVVWPTHVPGQPTTRPTLPG